MCVCVSPDVSVTALLFCLKVNLMQYMKLSTSRDFRINMATLEAALQEHNSSEVTPSSSFSPNSWVFFPEWWVTAWCLFPQEEAGVQEEEEEEPKQKKRKK